MTYNDNLVACGSYNYVILTHTHTHARTHAHTHTHTHTHKGIYTHTFSFFIKKCLFLMRIEKLYIFNMHLEIWNVFEKEYVYIFLFKNVANCGEVDCLRVTICSTLVCCQFSLRKRNTCHQYLFLMVILLRL